MKLAAAFVALVLLASAPAWAVNVNSDATLRAAIAGATDGDTITFTANITLLADLPAVQKSITIDGGGYTLDGASTYRGFFIAAWTPGTATFIAVNVNLRNLAIQNAVAKGGHAGGAGGGGAGLGGALFVADQASVTASNVTFDSNRAEGGDGGFGSSGGGGGMGGNGGAAGFGGGGGLGADGGALAISPAGKPGLATGAAGGGRSTTGAGGSSGGGGGLGGGGGFGFGGGGGGVGGMSSSGVERGYDGGFGGGGGDGSNGGNGGFGGGGGGGHNGGSGGNGGFGGGGGSVSTGVGGGGAAGFGGGTASDGLGAGGLGAGGAGMGGAIFVQQGGQLTLSGGLDIARNSVDFGEGPGGANGTNGSAFGSGIFIQGSNTITFSPAAGETQTINDVIADQTGSGGTGGNAGVASLTKNGTGTLVLIGNNTYTGGTSVALGILEIGAGFLGNATGSGPVSIGAGGTLTGSGSIPGGITLQSGGMLTTIGVLMTTSATWNAGGGIALMLGGDPATLLVPLAVTGPLTKAGTGAYTINLTDGGVLPGKTYTLMTFLGNAGFSASDFTVTGLSGTLTLEANALKFTTAPVPTTHGATMSVSKGKNRATFTITNTGSTATSFLLSQGTVASSNRTGPKPPNPPKPSKPAFEVVTTLNGANISRAVIGGTPVTIVAGGSAQAVVKIKSHRKLAFKRTIRILLRAVSQASPSTAASAQATLHLEASK